MEFREVLVAGGKALGIDIRRDMLDLFDLHYQALVEFGMETNLTSIEGREEVAVKHFLDSLVCSKAIEIEDDWRVVDVGTGAGFPGIPLKVQKPSLVLTLLEASRKRVEFLQVLASRLELTDTEVIWGRAEDIARNERHRETHDLVVARGVAEMAVLAELCLPFVKVGGVFAALKGPRVKDELPRGMKAIETMGGYMERIEDIALPWNYGQRSIVIIRKKTSTPEKYPRRPGIPAKRPIV
ncbi:MAG: 16S rRNA (guanine(527)-N(7))-methyltransferase RsmG [Bacillota bacterium]|jgi:16S rRNA (guanine527-N7)-methyltransferase|nr:16S rRNA (guanine(527)-N(7))-methyltransferase RsmG [Bacillota bacterium]MDI9415531.1 16S rRNA (guanine(527)-N(7))-methyltransferase RsmG [Bacillota bacterium]NLD11921.1 16S rRNA (guanine(527)-N(7))-methyltransferase RsmG [Bacillota bacterium]HCD42092.1 16S rRNA (guanine(527)-N(7))-methyltransferase RsmG [Bacillota bacterium]HOB89260.1 16S rRNA (guanine(527)-N(7))-methyltransferase RsmG [Bacillota bacterium]